MNYFDILARTWKTIWNHKVILAFGLLAMLVPGLLGLLMGGLMLFFSFDTFNLFERMMNNETWFVLAWLGFLGVFMLLSFFSTGVGWTGVFKGTFEVGKGKQNITFSELWGMSWPYIAPCVGNIVPGRLGSLTVLCVPGDAGNINCWPGLFMYASDDAYSYSIVIPVSDVYVLEHSLWYRR